VVETEQKPYKPEPAKPGRKKRDPIVAEQVTGRDYFRLVEPYLRRLNAAYPHPNRVLFYDDVVMAHLVAFFNPAVRSLRTIEDASRVPEIGKFFNADAVRRSTLSDANALFDPALAAGLIAALRARLPSTRGGGGADEQQLRRLLDSAVLVDGSFFRLAADVAWAIHAGNQHGGGKRGKGDGKPGIGTVRLNLQFSLRSGVATGVSINGADGVHESAAARPFVEPGQLYVFDSGIVSFAYLTDVLAAGSHFVCNLSAAVKFAAEAERPLTDRDRAAGVTSDTAGRLPGSPGHNRPPGAPLREVVVTYLDRNGKARTLRVLTDLMDLPAWAVAELYRQRWQVELFFRWLKVSANVAHLCSHSRNGITTAFQVATIAAMLMVLRTGKPLSKYGYNLMSMVASGLATVEDILPILEDRERERALARARLARKKAAKKPA
jgi:transposase